MFRKFTWPGELWMTLEMDVRDTAAGQVAFWEGRGISQGTSKCSVLISVMRFEEKMLRARSCQGAGRPRPALPTFLCLPGVLGGSCWRPSWSSSCYKPWGTWPHSPVHCLPRLSASASLGGRGQGQPVPSVRWCSALVLHLFVLPDGLCSAAWAPRVECKLRPVQDKLCALHGLV